MVLSVITSKSQKKPREKGEDQTEKRKKDQERGGKVAVSASVGPVLFSHVHVCSYVYMHVEGYAM